MMRLLLWILDLEKAIVSRFLTCPERMELHPLWKLQSTKIWRFPSKELLMEELHTDSIDGGHEGQLWARSRARERAYSNTPTRTLTGSGLGLC
jgi:hypothetical protein